MRNWHQIALWVVVLGLLLLVNESAQAQCAMCKAQLESGGMQDSDIARGLNKGIVLLMLIPYLLLMGGLWYFFGNDVKAYFKRHFQR